VLAAVEMTAKGRALVIERSELREAEDLEAATVREQGPRPVHEVVQASQTSHPFISRAQVKVVGIPENHLRPERHQVLVHHSLDGTCGSHGHECRGLDDAMIGAQSSPTRLTGPGTDFERESAHRLASIQLASP
jgi:hypothetical protein